ncbi:MAG: NAD-dependent epimerase/dehydratase family protein [Pseudonocardiaceae bacterium]
MFTDYYSRELKEQNLRIAREHPRFRLLELDLAAAPLRPVVEDVDGVFHLAGQPGVRPSWRASFPLYLHHNVQATQRVFSTAAEVGRRVVLASSSSVYGSTMSYPTAEPERTDPISPYGVTKLMCEKLAHAYSSEAGLDVVALRYFTVYGPRQRPDMAFSRIFDVLKRDGVFRIFGSGGQSRDVTYVLDAVRATIAAFERAPAGGIYNVGGGTEVSLREVIRIAEELTGSKLQTRFEGHAAGDMQRTAADISRICADTQWVPQTSLWDGLQAQLDGADARGPALADTAPMMVNQASASG